ncbi:MAG: VOC family protein [Pseudomonadales bacterium]|nr:VOC family protein [Pseudomonadales bacterium]
MYGVRDLEAGITEIEDLTGVRATFGGFHPGNGTCNALVSLSDLQYLEIIAPDPEQGLGGTLGEELIGQRGPSIRTWAVAAPALDDVAQTLTTLGMAGEVIEMGRTRPDGVQLNWRILTVSAHGFGNLMPFFIDWKDSPHPSVEAPGGCSLVEFIVTVEEAARFSDIMRALDVDVTVEEGPRVMKALLDSPNGRVELTSR